MKRLIRKAGDVVDINDRLFNNKMDEFKDSFKGYQQKDNESKEVFKNSGLRDDFSRLFERQIFGIGDVTDAKRYLMYATEDEDGYNEKVKMICDVFREILPKIEEIKQRTLQFIEEWPDDEVARVEYEGKKYAKALLNSIQYWTSSLTRDIENFGSL